MNNFPETASDEAPAESRVDYQALFDAAKLQPEIVELKRPQYYFETPDSVRSVTREIMPGEPGYEAAFNVRIDNYDFSGVRDGLVEQVSSGQLVGKEYEMLDRQLENKRNSRLTDSWWLLPEWQEKLGAGELNEIVSVAARGSEIKLYNFGETLGEAEATELKYVMDFMAQIKASKKYDVATAILLTPVGYNTEVTIDGKTEERAVLGSVNYLTRTIRVTPEGRDLESKEGETFSKVTHTITHEFAHLIEYDAKLRTEWATLAGWEEQADGWKLREGEKSPTSYGATSPAEDFAESVTYLILQPDQLDPKRRDFLIAKLLGEAEDEQGNNFEAAQPADARPDVQLTRTTGADMRLPESPHTIPFRITRTTTFSNELT